MLRTNFSLLPTTAQKRDRSQYFIRALDMRRHVFTHCSRCSWKPDDTKDLLRHFSLISSSVNTVLNSC